MICQECKKELTNERDCYGHDCEVTQLPIYKIKGKFYFLDKRLNEYRNIKNPNDRFNFNDISLKDLQKPTIKDTRLIYGGN